MTECVQPVRFPPRWEVCQCQANLEGGRMLVSWRAGAGQDNHQCGFRSEALMPIGCPKCGRVNPEYSRRCPCGHDFSAVASQPDVALQAAAPGQPAKVSVPHRCPLCQGANVRIDGWTGVDARVQFGKRWIGPGASGYGLNCFACLDCGYVGHYLCPEDLQTLQSMPVMADWPKASSRRGCMGAVLLLMALGVGGCVTAGRLLAG
jgi:hypothetical protein